MGIWLSMGGPSIHNMSGLSSAMHLHVLGRHVHCINHVGIVMLGVGCGGCLHLLWYSTLCVCWIRMCGLFGVLLCCVGLCKGLLCMRGCKWRVGVALCQFCGLGKVCSWGWDMLEPEDVLLVISHVLGVLKF